MNRAMSDREKVLVATARLAAHYVDAALGAGATGEEIGAALRRIASDAGEFEILITDEEGRIVLGTDHIGFVFPTDPGAETQSAPFAALLDGSETIVVQDPQPREADGKLFQYVGVGGIDRPRIVQIGVSAG